MKQQAASGLVDVCTAIFFLFDGAETDDMDQFPTRTSCTMYVLCQYLDGNWKRTPQATSDPGIRCRNQGDLVKNAAKYSILC